MVYHRSVWLFFGLTLLVSWAIWIPTQLLVPENDQLPLQLLGGFGPFLAATIIVVTKGKLGCRYVYPDQGGSMP